MKLSIWLCRRWLIAFCTLTPLTPAFQAVGAGCLPPSSGLTGWWPGDGNANDIQGINHGSLQGGATATGTGLVQSAFSLNGTNGYVQIPDAPDLRPANLTIEGWVRFNSLDSPGSGAPAGQTYIVFKQNTRTASFEGFNVFKTRVSSRDYLVFGVSSASGTVAEVQSTTQVAINTWYHFAGARGSNFIQIYVNGNLQGQTNVGFAQDYGSYPLYFGTSGQSSFDRKLNGSLDEVSLYNRALSSNEIAAIYNAGAAGKCKSLTITAEPQSQTVVAGSNVTFTVGAFGALPLGYQWQFNGAAIAQATNTSYSRTDVQPTEEGNYTVIVTNPTASVTSAVAVLTVLVPPAITVQPQSSTNALGGTTFFSSAVTGTAPLTFRWRHNGVTLTNGARISGATTDTLQIPNIQPADAGNYVLVATNAAGAATSSPALLAVSGPPFILAQPANQSAAAGAGASFGVTATGTTPLSYQWQHNGADLANGGSVAGATNDTLLLTNVQTNNVGNYQVVITNSEGAVTSQVAVLTVNQAPFISTQPASQAVRAGTNVMFTVVASGAEPLSYQWRFNGTNLVNGGQVSGATASALALTVALPDSAGPYSVVVTNFLGSMTSTVAILTVTPSDRLQCGASRVGRLVARRRQRQRHRRHQQRHVPGWGHSRCPGRGRHRFQPGWHQQVHSDSRFPGAQTRRTDRRVLGKVEQPEHPRHQRLSRPAIHRLQTECASQR